MLAAVAGLAAMIALFGCKKKSEPARSSSAVVAEAGDAASTNQTQQTVCPVMAGAINKNIYTEYKGKKVYFCCADCKAKFEADPEKYIVKLPQFAK